MPALTPGGTVTSTWIISGFTSLRAMTLVRPSSKATVSARARAPGGGGGDGWGGVRRAGRSDRQQRRGSRRAKQEAEGRNESSHAP